MRPDHLLAIGAAMSALLVFAATDAVAGSRGVGSGFRHRPLPPPVADGFLGFPGVYVVERVQIIEREVVKEAPPPPPTPEPRRRPANPMPSARPTAAFPAHA